MNSTVCLVFMLSTIFSTTEANLSEEHVHHLKQFSAECMDTSGVSPDSLMKATAGEFTSDAQLAEYFLCMFKKPGFMNDAGEFVIDTIKEKMVQKFGQEVADSIVKDCVDFDGGMAEKATHFARCIFERKPIQMM